LATLSITNELSVQIISGRRDAVKVLGEIVGSLPHHVQLLILIPRPFSPSPTEKGRKKGRKDTQTQRAALNDYDQSNGTKPHFESAVYTAGRDVPSSRLADKPFLAHQSLSPLVAIIGLFRITETKTIL